MRAVRASFAGLPALIAARPPASVLMLIRFGVRDVCIGTKIDALKLTGIARHDRLRHIVASAGMAQPAGTGASSASGRGLYLGVELQRLVQAN